MRAYASVACFFVVCLGACASLERRGADSKNTGPTGVWHRVAPGESYSQIAGAYGIPLRSLLRANRAPDPDHLEAGARILVPGASRVLSIREVRDAKPALLRRREVQVEPGAAQDREAASQHAGAAGEPGRADSARPPPIKLKTPIKLAWPVVGRLVERFGRHGDRLHEGIDIGAPEGSPVRAAAAGDVIYSGRRAGGYGNHIVISHGDRFQTAYAHNRTNVVREGQRVVAGQEIGTVGMTGRALTPRVHFEIRDRGKAIDPLQLLGDPTEQGRP